jgi:hypothetical protein
MPAPQDQKRFTGFRNPFLYTSILMVAALFYVGWVFTARRQEAREIEERAQEQRKTEASRTYEVLGGNRFEILDFYAVPGAIHRGDSAQLCYGVSNAKTIKLEPQTGAVWPSLSRCVNVAPKKDTTYTLTAEDGQGNTRTATLTVQVR